MNLDALYAPPTTPPRAEHDLRRAARLLFASVGAYVILPVLSAYAARAFALPLATALTVAFVSAGLALIPLPIAMFRIVARAPELSIFLRWAARVIPLAWLLVVSLVALSRLVPLSLPWLGRALDGAEMLGPLSVLHLVAKMADHRDRWIRRKIASGAMALVVLGALARHRLEDPSLAGAKALFAIITWAVVLVAIWLLPVDTKSS